MARDDCRFLFWLFVGAIVVRLFLLGAVWHAHGSVMGATHGDDGYYEIATNLAAGHGFSSELSPPYTPNALRTPGYLYSAAFVLTLTHRYLALALLSIVLGALVPLLGYLVARELTGARVIARGVGVILALDPFFWLFSFVMSVETLFLVLFLPFVLALLAYQKHPRTRTVAIAAALLGLVILVKPTVQYFPVLLIPFIVWFAWQRPWRTRVLHAALFAFIPLLILMPWLYRNDATFGVAGISAQPAYNLYVYLAPSVLALARGEAFNTEFLTYSTPAERDGNAITLANSPAYRAKALDTIAAHPSGLVRSMLMTFFAFFTHDGMLTVLESAGIGTGVHLTRPAPTLLVTNPLALFSQMGRYLASPLVLVLVFRLFWVLVTILFGVGVVARLREQPRDASLWLALFLVAYFAVTSVVGGLGVTARYRMPVDALILAYALSGFLTLKNAIVPKLHRA